MKIVLYYRYYIDNIVLWMLSIDYLYYIDISVCIIDKELFKSLIFFLNQYILNRNLIL